MKYVYIAGPMSHRPNFNFDAFFAAEQFLLERHMDGWENDEGLYVFNPARRDLDTYGAELAANPTGSISVAELKHGFSLRQALQVDTHFICSQATGMFMLADWEDSMGARAEHALGQAIGLDIEYQKPTNWLAMRDTPTYQMGYAHGYEDGVADTVEGQDNR